MVCMIYFLILCTYLCILLFIKFNNHILEMVNITYTKHLNLQNIKHVLEIASISYKNLHKISLLSKINHSSGHYHLLSYPQQFRPRCWGARWRKINYIIVDRRPSPCHNVLSITCTGVACTLQSKGNSAIKKLRSQHLVSARVKKS